jgi:hypothetical protein
MPASEREGGWRGLRRRTLVAAASLSALISAIPACNMVAPALYAVDGPGKIPAEHELAEVRTVVFVDDRRNIFPRTALRTSIGAAIASRTRPRAPAWATTRSRWWRGAEWRTRLHSPVRRARA